MRKALRLRWRCYLGLAASWIWLASLVIAAKNRGGSAGFGLHLSWWRYVLTQFPAVLRYLLLSLAASARLRLWDAGERPAVVRPARGPGGDFARRILGLRALAFAASGASRPWFRRGVVFRHPGPHVAGAGRAADDGRTPDVPSSRTDRRGDGDRNRRRGPALVRVEPRGARSVAHPRSAGGSGYGPRRPFTRRDRGWPWLDDDRAQCSLSEQSGPVERHRGAGSRECLGPQRTGLCPGRTGPHCGRRGGLSEGAVDQSESRRSGK